MKYILLLCLVCLVGCSHLGATTPIDNEKELQYHYDYVAGGGN